MNKSRPGGGGGVGVVALIYSYYGIPSLSYMLVSLLKMGGVGVFHIIQVTLGQLHD